MARIRIDLQGIYKSQDKIDAELTRVIGEAVKKRVSVVEIVHGKEKGELKKHVLRFLAQPKIKGLYHRVEKDDKNLGRIFVHFRLHSERKKIGLFGHPGLLFPGK
ncbi:MAG TPA: DNA mismatch repair protein MutS [Candidatus Omnitrophica bacterium]|nr:DNA mismatch repair protein MutS [Candidatus Omnitrophota bacterium]